MLLYPRSTTGIIDILSWAPEPLDSKALKFPCHFFWCACHLPTGLLG
jgi:hypothetical protein